MKNIKNLQKIKLILLKNHFNRLITNAYKKLFNNLRIALNRHNNSSKIKTLFFHQKKALKKFYKKILNKLLALFKSFQIIFKIAKKNLIHNLFSKRNLLLTNEAKGVLRVCKKFKLDYLLI